MNTLVKRAVSNFNMYLFRMSFNPNKFPVIIATMLDFKGCKITAAITEDGHRISYQLPGNTLHEVITTQEINRDLFAQTSLCSEFSIGFESFSYSTDGKIFSLKNKEDCKQIEGIKAFDKSLMYGEPDGEYSFIGFEETEDSLIAVSLHNCPNEKVCAHTRTIIKVK